MANQSQKKAGRKSGSFWPKTISQQRILKLLLGSSALYLLVASWGFGWVKAILRDDWGVSKLPPDHILAIQAADQIRVIGIIYWASCILVVLCATAIALLVAEKVSGPVFSLQRHLRQVRERRAVGEALRFRGKDVFQELLEDYNAVIAELEELRAKNRS